MQKRYLLALSFGMLCSYSLVSQAATNRIETRKAITRGTKDGKTGTWFKVYEDRYFFMGDIPAILTLYQKELGITPSNGEIEGILEKLNSGKLTSEQLESNVRLRKDVTRDHIVNIEYDTAIDFTWELEGPANRFKRRRTWNAEELKHAFGPLPAREMTTVLGFSNPMTSVPPRAARHFSEAYRFLKIAEMMEKTGLASIDTPIDFSIQLNEKIGMLISDTADRTRNRSVIAKFEYCDTLYNLSKGLVFRRFSVNHLTADLARQIAKDLYYDARM